VLQSPDGAAVRAYLDKRAISRKIAVRFGMGASPDSWDALLQAMTAKGYTKTELVTAGLDVPQVTRIAMALRGRGLAIDPAVYTVDELSAELVALRKGGGAKC